MVFSRLIYGDCIEEMHHLIENDLTVDMVLTDPPYNITNCKWDSSIDLEEMWGCLNELVNENTPILLFGNEPFSSSVRLSSPIKYKYDIIWDKVTRTGHLNSKKQPLRQYENIMVFYNAQCTYNPIMWVGKEENHNNYAKTPKTNVYNAHKGVPPKLTKMKYPTNIIQFNARADECNNIHRVHPTQKPIKLLEYLIKTYTNPKDVVLDFTMGSGSTGVACRNTGRKFIGIENNEDYFNIAIERIKRR